MDSDSFKKSLLEVFRGTDPDLLKRLIQDENLSEVSLVGKMLWGLIATGRHNEELCSWAAEVMSQTIMVLPEEDSPIQQEIRKALIAGRSAEEVARDFGENSEKVFPAYTRLLVLAVAKLMQSNSAK